MKIRTVVSVFLTIYLLTFCEDGFTFDNYRFEQFSTPEGLPNNMVHNIYQDQDGYIWIATYYGLFRYDGYEVKTIKSNLYTPGMLINNNVMCVREDKQSRLWIGTHDGLCIMDKKDGEIRKIKVDGVTRQRINDIYITEDEQIYLGYIRGLAVYDIINDSVYFFNRMDSTGDVPENINIQCIIDYEGDILIGTWRDGIFRYSPDDNNFTQYNSTELNSILSMYKDGSGKLWIGTSGMGLYEVSFTVDKTDILFNSYRHENNNNRSLSSDYIYSISEDTATNTLRLGSRKGVSIMNFNQPGTFVNYNKSEAENYLPVDEVNSVFRDKNGIMWIGTKGSGVLYSNSGSGYFNIPHNAAGTGMGTDYISTLYVEKSGTIWAGFGYGAAYLKDEKYQNIITSGRPYHISYSNTTDEILITIQDEGIIACRNGEIVGYYNASNSAFIPNNLIFTIYEDTKGNWWLGTYNGLGIRYNDGRFYSLNRMEESEDILKKEITAIIETTDGKLWLATNNNGIACITGDTGQPETFGCKHYNLENGFLPVNTPLCFLQDRDGRLWAGTEGSGLCL